MNAACDQPYKSVINADISVWDGSCHSPWVGCGSNVTWHHCRWVRGWSSAPAIL